MILGCILKVQLTFVGHLDHPVQSVEEVCVETKNHRKIRDVKKGKKVGKIVRFENSQNKKIRQIATPSIFTNFFPLQNFGLILFVIFTFGRFFKASLSLRECGAPGGKSSNNFLISSSFWDSICNLTNLSQ